MSQILSNPCQFLHNILVRAMLEENIDNFQLCVDIDYYFDSPLVYAHPIAFLDSDPDEEMPGLGFSLAQPKGKKRAKVDKMSRIRTNKNSQKIYHNILKHWLAQNQCQILANKYSKYFNQRIYFILALHEIGKRMDSEEFLRSYQQLATEVKKKKEREIKSTMEEVERCEYINHLARIIEEIDYSVAACRQFLQGNVLDAIIVVFKRSQKKITKVKEFKEALRIFQRETGSEPENL